ncbi:MAG: hypothetical protein HQL37_01710 [Alphaproteobacteria bacterium]|nr:hypothetical protein [Alphaproteobacteria bacterium]
MGCNYRAWRVLYANLWILMLFSCFDAPYYEFKNDTNTIESNGLAPIGKQLRADIDNEYKRLVETHSLKGGLESNDLTEIVTRYIPVGSTFDDAENILRNAGFMVEPRSGTKSISFGESVYGVYAKIDQYVHIFMSKTSIYVFLLSKSPGDYSTVSKIEASLTIQMP